jgi:murein L,D-transpeptidase YafK
MPRWHICAMRIACTCVLLFGASAQAYAQFAPPLLGPYAPAVELTPPAPPSGNMLPTESRFMLEQLRHDRVRDARLLTRFNLKQLFHERGISYPAAEIFLRAFKRERVLEVWVRPAEQPEFTLLKTYVVCAQSGAPGPKRRQGDMQVPEGFYHVSMFNPRSGYHLSLGVDYPNQRDRLAGNGGRLGGDIFIHGGCLSEGCLAITDDGIREVYWLAVEARAAGQHRIPVHIFPARLNAGEMQVLERNFATAPDVLRFWKTLQPGYDFFEKHHRVPAMGVSGAGEYALSGFAELSRPMLAEQPWRDGTSRGSRAAVPGRAPLGTPVLVPE